VLLALAAMASPLRRGCDGHRASSAWVIKKSVPQQEIRTPIFAFDAGVCSCSGGLGLQRNPPGRFQPRDLKEETQLVAPEPRGPRGHYVNP